MTPPPPVKPPPPKKVPASLAASAKKAPPSAKRALPGSRKQGLTTKKRKTKREHSGEKSTTTTTTHTANTPVNVYDAVLGEAEDLLAAAQEAQALGRLKMASAYQLLLHARLVGLGKRFDRAETYEEPETASTTTTAPASTTTSGSPTNSPASIASLKDDTTTTTCSPPSSTPTKKMPNGTTTTVAQTPDTDNKKTTATPVHAELAKLLPSNVEMDSAMMEHLARAAMELHHQRTGRRIQSDLSPQKGGAAGAGTPTTTKTTPNGTTANSSNTRTPSSATTTTTTTSGVAWTEEEVTKIQAELSKGTTDPSVISKAVGTRTEAQVKAYLRNTQERQKGAKAVEQEWNNKEVEVSPRKRGGRGRKPPTQAMNTVPNAKLDAKSLLSGKAL